MIIFISLIFRRYRVFLYLLIAALPFFTLHPAYADQQVQPEIFTGPSAIQSDGKLLLTGSKKTNAADSPESNQLFVKRVNVDGSIDSTFGINGQLDFNILGNDSINKILTQPDGKIILLAQAEEPCNSRYITMGIFVCNTVGSPNNPSHQAHSIGHAILRLTPSGEMDKSFNKTGMAIAPISSVNSSSIFSANSSLAFTPDGKIIIATSYTSYSFGYPRLRFANVDVATISADGTSVELLASPGFLVCRENKSSSGSIDLFPSQDGSFVLAANFGLEFPCLVKFNMDGTKDPSFGSSVSDWKGVSLSSFRGISKAAENDGYIVYGIPKECTSTGAECGTIKSYYYNSKGEMDSSYSNQTTEKKSTVVEYFNSRYNHYFLTADPQEIAIVDTNPDWKRTGLIYIVNTTENKELLTVCRFFSEKFTSHFYALTGNECDAVKNNQDWRYEKNAFFVSKPVDGKGYVAPFCQNNSTPLYRLYNQYYLGAPNHRYTTCGYIRDNMIKRGWASEGITMCIADQNIDCTNDTTEGGVNLQ